jgi:hypothetical protein
MLPEDKINESELHPVNNQSTMFFIIGMPRSGTKLLRSLLNRHSDIYIPELETDFFPFLSSRMSVIGDCSREESFNQLYSDLLSQPFFVYLTDADSLPDKVKWFGASKNFFPAQVFEALLRTVTNTLGNESALIGDKSPDYINQMGTLTKHFPAARYIHIVRDVRDYSLSMNKAWGKNMIRAANAWARSVGALQPYVSELGTKIIELRYEDLLGETESEVRKICQFLSIEFQPDMLTLDKATENLGDTKGLVEVVSGNVQKYKVALPVKKLARIEKLSCNILHIYGYEFTWGGSQSRLNFVYEKYLQLMDGFNLVISAQKERGVWGAIMFHWAHFRATRT